MFGILGIRPILDDMASSAWRENGALLYLALSLLSAPALAAESEPANKRLYLDVNSPGACPTSERIQDELLPLLDSWQIVSSAEEAQEIARISERGDVFEVSVVGDTRVVSDPARDCEERARVSAVIIALRLEPLSPAEEVPETSVVEDAPQSEPHRGRSPTELELGMGVLVQKSLDDGGGPGAGPVFSLIFSWERWLLLGSVAALSSTKLAEADPPVTVSRFPIDLGLGRRIFAGGFALEPSLLLAVDNFRIAADNLESGSPSGRLEVGPRARVRLAYRRIALRPFAALGLSYFPRDYSLRVNPVGEIARTPHYFFEMSVGVGLPLFAQ